MRRWAVLAGVLAALGVAAPAHAYFSLVADGVHIRGTIRLIAYGDPSLERAVISERGKVIADRPLVKATVDPEHGQLYATVVDAPWRCARRTRRFTAVATGPYGKQEQSAFTIRTPSCANRLTLGARPGRVTVADTFARGGVRATLCAPTRCRVVRLPLGKLKASVRLPVGRGDVVRLRNRYQRLRLRVGVRDKGGPVVLTTGDSLMQNLDVVLTDRLRRRARVLPDLRFGAGLANEVVSGPWLDIARAQVARNHPRVTVVFLGTNDLYPIGDTPCCGADWSAAYEARARATMRVYAQGGAGSVVWLTVPYDRDIRRRAAETAVNGALRRAALAVPGVTIIPADDIFTPGGAYEGRFREPDGIHLNLLGSRIAARYVITALRRLGIV